MPPALVCPATVSTPRMRRRHVLRAGTGAALALPFLSRGAQAAVTWTLFTQQVNPSSVVVRMLQRLSDMVRDRSRGAMLLNVRTAGYVPVDANQVLEAVATGKVELGDDGSYATSVAAGGLARLPLLANTPEEWSKVSGLLQPALNAELERRGIVLLAHYRSALQLFWSRQRAASFADIARQRLRVQSVEQAEFVRQYGGLHLTMSTVEAAEALQAGKMDGTFGTAAVAGRAWKELLKHVYTGGPNYNDAVIVVGREALQRLPAGLEPVLRAATAEFATAVAAALDQEEVQILRQLRNDGLKTTAVNPEEVQDGISKLPAYWDSWVRLRGGETENLLATIRQALDR